jgi:nicotinamidase-related amidase
LSVKPLPAGTRHLCIDMQRLFAEQTDWYTPGMAVILPQVVALSARPSLFARFMVPETADHATGQWRDYYRRWAQFTGRTIDPALLDLMAPLAALAGPGAVIDKVTYSVFEAPGFAARLAAEGVEALVFSGVETDVCVLASLMAAVDRGFRVVAAVDALSSSNLTAHQAVIDHVLPRMADQVEIVPTAEILAAWPG